MPATCPDQVVSIDQLNSLTPGFIGQTTRALTSQCSYVVTVFVDHMLELDFVYPQEITSVADSIEEKSAFKLIAKEHGVKVSHYHCNNGIVASKQYKDAVTQARQTIVFCGVSVYHQNGVTECHINNLCEHA